jgi:hypothetical protein
MKYPQNIERLMKRFCARKRSTVKTTRELNERILGDALLARKTSTTTQSAAMGPDIWRIVMQSRITKYATAAAIILVMIIGIIELGKSAGGAGVVFAAAMNSVRQAGTFSCMEIFEVTYEDDGQDGKYLMKQKWMFKEPDWERHEALTSPWPKYVGETTITDYGTRQELRLRPVEKTARLSDLSSDYTVDDETGELKLTQLNTRLRDRLLEWSAGAVEDHGRVELDGRSVRMLQSHRDNRVTTVWIDPETNYPVQVEHQWTDQSRSPVMITAIQIDTELDDNLFSLEPPEGYIFSVDKSRGSDEEERMLTKMMHLGKYCLIYANQHNDLFPGDLADLVAAGIITDEALRNVRAAPDGPDGPPVIQYRQPDTSVEDWAIEVMLYEVHDGGLRDNLVAVTMLDSHAELIPVRVLEQFLKPWPSDKKKISACMAYLYRFCGQYAKEHVDRYPAKLADLVGVDVSEEAVTRLQSAWGQHDGREVIRYRPPRTNADPTTEVMFYEICDQWSDDGAVVCYVDGHCEIIVDRNRFEELIK